MSGNEKYRKLMKNISETGIKHQQLGMTINPRVGEPEEIVNEAIFLGPTKQTL